MQVPYNMPIKSEVTNNIVQDNDVSEFTIVKKLYESAKVHKHQFDKDWQTRWDFYKGKQNNNKPVMNIVRSNIQSLLPILTDARPGINVLPSEPSDYKFSKIMQTLIEYWWDKPCNAMQHTLIEILMDQSIYDAGIGKVFYDIDINDVRVKSIDPRNIYVNKEAVDFDKDCTYVIEKMYLPLSWVKTNFPEKANIVSKDPSQKKDEQSMEMKEVRPINERQEIDTMLSNPLISESDCREMVEVWECWLDSEEMETITTEDSITTVKKYPNGKLITMLPNQNIVLQSTENPYKHGKKPYVRFIDTILPHSFWGEGEVEPLIPAQKNVNLVLTNILAYFKLLGNPIWKMTSDCGVDSSAITNDTALVLEVDPGHMGDIMRDIPPALQPGVTELFSMTLRNAEIESGVNEVSQGRRPVGITAAAAIEALQEASQTRVRLKERNLQTSLMKMSTMIIELFMQYYSTPRVVRITGDNDWPEFFEFYIDNAEKGYNLHRKDIKFNKDSDSYVEGSYNQYGPFKGVFDLRIMSGTSQPMAKAARSNLAMQLYQAGVIKKKSLLETIEWPTTAEELAEDENMNNTQGEQK